MSADTTVKEGRGGDSDPSAKTTVITGCIVIPTYKRPEVLAQTLTALAACDWPSSFAGIWVVENGPESGAEEVCASFASRLPIHWVHVSVAGLSNARNVGIRESRGDIVLFLDDDIRPQKGALIAYARAFQENGTAAFYGGPVHPDYEKAPPEWLMPFLSMSAFGFSLGTRDKEVNESTFLGGNHAVPRHLLRDGYDHLSATESGGGVGEEMRLQQSLLDRGVKGRYVADGAVWHQVPEDRCSPAWVLKREYRFGLTAGALRRSRTRKSIPRWIWRQFVESSAQDLLLTLGRRPLPQRFPHKVKLAFARGYISAYRSEQKP